MQFQEGRFLVWVLGQLCDVLEAQALVLTTPLMPAHERRRRHVAPRRKVMERPLEKPQSRWNR
jgi:hypothetical protein